MTDIFKSLKIDAWYMMFVYLGGVLLIFSIFFQPLWITNKLLFLFSLGMLLIGLGEWKNHKFVSGIKSSNAYTGPAAFIQTKIRQSDLVGLLFDTMGIILILYGLVYLLKSI